MQLIREANSGQLPIRSSASAVWTNYIQRYLFKFHENCVIFLKKTFILILVRKHKIKYNTFRLSEVLKKLTKM